MTDILLLLIGFAVAVPVWGMLYLYYMNLKAQASARKWNALFKIFSKIAFLAVNKICTTRQTNKYVKERVRSRIGKIDKLRSKLKKAYKGNDPLSEDELAKIGKERFKTEILDEIVGGKRGSNVNNPPSYYDPETDALQL